MITITEDRDSVTHRDLVALVAQLMKSDEAGRELSVEEGTLLGELENGTSGVLCGLVAYLDGKSVGCVTLAVEPQKQLMELGRLYVLEGFRGRGVATLLLEAAETWSHDHGVTELHFRVAKENNVAALLYAKRSYTLRDEGDGYLEIRLSLEA